MTDAEKVVKYIRDNGYDGDNIWQDVFDEVGLVDWEAVEEAQFPYGNEDVIFADGSILIVDEREHHEIGSAAWRVPID